MIDGHVVTCECCEASVSIGPPAHESIVEAEKQGWKWGTFTASRIHHFCPLHTHEYNAFKTRWSQGKQP